ncbi:MAG: hypothetical protein ABIL28_02275 [candidate division WOR-3 bacterium]
MFFALMFPQVNFSLDVYEEFRGSRIILLKLINGKGVKLNTEDFSFCEVKILGKFLEPEYWKDLQDTYFSVQGTDLPFFTFIYKKGNFQKTVKVYGPPNFPEKIKEVFLAIKDAKCGREVKPKVIVLFWERVYVRRIATPIGDFGELVGKDILKGKDALKGYEFLKKYGPYLIRDGIFADGKGNTYMVGVKDIGF